MSSDDVKRALNARQDRRPSAEPPPVRHAWIAERLEKLARKDELLRQMGYLKPDTTEGGDDARDDD